MDAPRMVNADQLIEMIVNYYRQRCHSHGFDEDGPVYNCNACHTQIMHTDGAISIHSVVAQVCAGSGAVLHLQLPYCIQCEGPPRETSGCVHITNGHRL